MTARWELLAQAGCRPGSTRPIGTPATYGAPSWLPQVTTTSPLGRAPTASSTSSRSRRPSSPTAPRPRRKPTSMLAPTPAADDRVGWSTTSSTVAVVPVTRRTRPTRPSLLRRSCPGGCPARVPASMVTVREKDCAGPMRDHPGRAPGRSRCVVGGRRCRPSSSASAVAVEPALASCAARAGSSRPRAGRRRRAGAPVVRNQPGTAVNGRTAAAVPVSTGPKHLADRAARRLDGRVVAAAGVEGDQRDAGEHQRDEQRARDGRCARPSRRSRRGRRSPGPSVPPAARRRAPAAAPRTPRRTCRRPCATEVSGSSATCTGMPVSWRSRSSRPRSSAPPPVSTMPRSMMSPASSGGVWSRVARTASTIACSGSSRACRTSALETTTVRGQPGDHVAAADLGLRLARAAGRPSRGSS